MKYTSLLIFLLMSPATFAVQPSQEPITQLEDAEKIPATFAVQPSQEPITQLEDAEKIIVTNMDNTLNCDYFDIDLEAKSSEINIGEFIEQLNTFIFQYQIYTEKTLNNDTQVLKIIKPLFTLQKTEPPAVLVSLVYVLTKDKEGKLIEIEEYLLYDLNEDEKKDHMRCTQKAISQ